MPRKVYIKELIESKTNLKLISFHMSSACHEPIVSKYGICQCGGKVYSRHEMCDNAESNIAWIRSFLDSDIDIAIENNNYYPTSAYNDITEGDFISNIVKMNNTYFLFDIAHAIVTACNKGLSSMPFP